MNRLFIELYLDEDVDVLVADLMRPRGFAATTARDIGMRGKLDDDQLAYAVTQQWAIVTHNRTDYEQLAEAYFVAGQTHYGIIIAHRQSAYKICPPPI